MSSGGVRWLLSQRMASVFADSVGYLTSASRLGMCTVRSGITASSCRWVPFSTDAGNPEKVPVEKKKKALDPRARATVTAVGRKIPQRQIQVISDMGEDMGSMHRSDVIRIMDEKGLKLVLLSEHKDPPLYKLMTGKQIHEEQLKVREKQKSKAGTYGEYLTSHQMLEINSDCPAEIRTFSIWKGADFIPSTAPVQVKELTFSHGIAAHDLITKVKQIESWLEKNNHIRVTLRARRGQPADNLVRTLACWKRLFRDFQGCSSVRPPVNFTRCSPGVSNESENIIFIALVYSLQCAKLKEILVMWVK